MRIALLLTATALFAPMSAHGAAAPSVRVEAGLVTGQGGDGVDAFLGIPYAAPPVGPLRWRAPQPVAPWTGARQATGFPAPCMQQGRPDADAAPSPSEDCLYLNVWRPQGRAGRSLPVLVWIHGGAFRAGSTADPRIAGDMLARQGLIVVTIQYRLGVFGFLSHPELTREAPDHVSGNYGLRDQIAALQWVRRNIAAFGGDPARVTIGGLSAGAISTAMLAAAPQARGLFHGIISMSGGSFAPPRSPAEPGENMEPLAQAEGNGLRFAAGMGAADIPALRQVPADRLARADSMGVGWPVIDGRLIPGDEHELYARGGIADVPLLLGTTADEGFNFSRITSLPEYEADVPRRYGGFAPRILAAYPATDDRAAVRQSRDLLRDVMFGWGTWNWASQQSRYGKARAYAYYFGHVAPRNARTPADAGATHGSDQPYPFGIAHQDRAWTAADHRISDAMLGYFANFVKTGNPNGAGLPRWPAFGRTAPQVLHVEDDMRPGPVANRDRIHLIDDYMAARRRDGGLGAPR